MRGNIGNGGKGEYGGIPSDTSICGKQSTVDRAKISAWKSKYTNHQNTQIHMVYKNRKYDDL